MRLGSARAEMTSCVWFGWYLCAAVECNSASPESAHSSSLQRFTFPAPGRRSTKTHVVCMDSVFCRLYPKSFVFLMIELISHIYSIYIRQTLLC
ncbi:hypothetical protein B0H14DRAFT_975200 [Mycena olivaceomarginata]|nr:hypothetical protein B0H14DRAFT_975200 [Mycena olivaceomarginata]